MLMMRMIVVSVPQSFIWYLLMSFVLAGCMVTDPLEPGMSALTPSPSSAESAAVTACPVTEPVWLKPPADAAVQNPPGYGYYFVNDDRSMWAAAGWTKDEEYRLQATEDGIKVGWFRPAGAALEITGQRLDGQAPPFEAHIPCCYPTRLQAKWISTAKKPETRAKRIEETARLAQNNVRANQWRG